MLNRQGCCVTGVEDGQTVRMPVGNKEVFITFRVEKSDYFHRDGADVHTDAEISFSQAVLGGTIRVRGLYEDQTVQVLFNNNNFFVCRVVRVINNASVNAVDA